MDNDLNLMGGILSDPEMSLGGVSLTLQKTNPPKFQSQKSKIYTKNLITEQKDRNPLLHMLDLRLSELRDVSLAV